MNAEELKVMLFEAIQLGDIKNMEESILQGANIEANIEADGVKGITPLMLAIQQNNEKMVKLLIENKAKIEAKNSYSETPLMLAIEQNNEKIVKLLIDNHADIEAKNSRDETPLMLAVKKNTNEDIVELLITFGTQKESIEKTFMSILSRCDEYNFRDIFIKNGVSVQNAFANASYINWGSPLVREYALEINHKYSEVIKVFGNEDITIDQYKECFYQAKEVKKAYKDDLNIDQLMHSVFLQGGKELISTIVNETPPDQHKDLVKWLTVFGAKFSFYNSEKILLISQSYCNEIEKYEKDSDGGFINFKKMSKSEIRDEKLYNVHTGKIINECKNVLYVIDKKGQLYINTNKYPLNHSFMLNGYSKIHNLDGIPIFGYGKPVGCGGTLNIKDGVITQIYNNSGHYRPDKHMLMQTCHTLLKSGGIAKGGLLHDHRGNIITLEQIENFDVEEVIASGDYFYLDY